MKENIAISELIIKEIDNTISEKEKIELNSWRNNSDSNNRLYNSILNGEDSDERIDDFSKFDFDKDWAKIYYKINKPKAKKLNLYKLTTRVAAVVLPIAIAIGIFNNINKVEAPQPTFDILPGSNKAVLVLDSGEKIDLKNNDTVINIADNSNIKIKSQNITYIDKQNTCPQKLQHNTLIIPRGGEYSLTLSDGTKVWLNSDTKLKYPLEFLASTREVDLLGEAYFEVSKDAKKPFIVNVDGKQIEVIGTKFNVRSYKDDDEFSATLNEGRVRVTVGRNSVLLLPNQQAYGKGKYEKFKIRKVDASCYSAWKDMKFVYNDQYLDIIMRDISRWYDVDIVFTNEDLKSKRFSAFVPRYSTLSEMLGVISTTEKVKFKITGKKVEVLSAD